MFLLRACSGILANIEENCALSGLHVQIPRREKTARFTGLPTRDVFLEMVKRKDFYVMKMVFPFTASCSDENFGFKGPGEVTRTSVH